MIRHGRSLGNDMMDKPGNRWGDANFQDDATLIDSPLNDLGKNQAKSMSIEDQLKDAELVVVSPLTRTLETFQYGVLPKLPDGVPIIAQPLSAERVYTTSDTGRVAAELKTQFPSVDFSLMGEEDKWWFHTDNPGEEWRPHKEGQFYGVPGEPKDVFEDRMVKYQQWLATRPESNIVMVSHWAILRYFTGDQFENCEARIVQWNPSDVSKL